MKKPRKKDVRRPERRHEPWFQKGIGDDVRAIEWRVTARSGTAHTKLFHEDREQPILVAIDQRTPMKFGSTRCFKSVMAAHVGTLALWSALGAGERVGGIVLGDHTLSDTRPKRSQHSVLRVIGDLVREGVPSASVSAPSNRLSDLLQQLERQEHCDSVSFFCHHS